jgi:toxin-antitoxin system PIN domain toxin
MKRCLADVNVLLPLLVRHHEHHKLALRWFDGLAPGEAVLCRSVQLALVRLLGNRTVMGKYAVSASAVWRLIEELMQDERIEFASEPPLVDDVLPKLLRYAASTRKLVGDAYLAAFSIAGQMRLTTVDNGFKQFRDLDLDLLRLTPPG